MISKLKSPNSPNHVSDFLMNRHSSSSKSSSMSPTKAILIGDTGVGKTSIQTRLDSGQWDECRIPTVGGSFSELALEGTDGSKCSIALWDTAGQERYKTIVPIYFERAEIIIAVYAVNDRSTYASLESWITLARGKAAETARLLIIANKSDMVEARSVSIPELDRIATENHAATALEVSAKTGAGMRELRRAIADEAIGLKLNSFVRTPRIAIEVNNEEGRCCFLH
jgi:small GTP-binding protein